MTPFMLDAEEDLGLHLLYALRGPERAPMDVVIVAIDSESADVLGLPLAPNRWPRLLHARLLDQLTAAQAAVVAFDLFFHDPLDAVGDQIFATAMRDAGNVVLAQAIDRQTMPLGNNQSSRTAHLNIERMISAIPLLADAASAQAPFPLPTVPVKLNQFWCFRSGSGNVPTLPVVAFHVYAREAFGEFIHLLRNIDARIDETFPVSVSAGDQVPLMVQLIRPLHARFEKDSRLSVQVLERLDGLSSQAVPARTLSLIHSLTNLYRYGNSRYLNLYGPAGTFTTIPYHRFMAESQPGRIGGDLVIPKGAAVFVGQTGSNWIKTHDAFYTAFSGKAGKNISGVEIAATAFANLLENKAVFPLQPATSVTLLFAWGVLIALIGLHFSTIVSVVGLLLLNGIYLAVAHLQFTSSGTWIPLIVPILIQTPAGLISGLAWKHRQVTIDRKNIREAFGHYLPDDVVDRLSANLTELRLGGQVFYGVCLFTDAQNYTTLSETMEPDQLTELMNRYYEAVFRPIKTNGGVVLQVVGDSILAIWTAKEPKPALKRSACRAAIGIAASVDQFNRQAGGYAMPTRIGIHAGDMLLGNIGAMDHFEYRPVGDIVNTASRLEGLNKFLKTSMLVSRELIDADNEFTVRSVGHFVFKGKSQPVHVFELLAPEKLPRNTQAAVCRIFAAGLDAFQHRLWDEAEERFNQVLRLDETDGPALFYLEYCRAYRHMPPDGGWDGVVHLEKK